MFDSLAAWLGQISWPIVSRVLTSLGFGYVTYEGAGAALENALSAAKAAMGGLAGEVVQFLAMAGFFDFMSITSGGLVGGLAWMALKKFAVTNTGA